LSRAPYIENTIASAPNRVAARVAAFLGIAAEGVPIVAAITASGIVVVAIGFIGTGIALMLAAAAVGAFFRDPQRETTAARDAIVSGADGKVCDIGEARLPGRPSDQVYRTVSIFMSPLDVHVNRAPVSGEVVSVEHTPGEFRAAFHDEASVRNERNLIIFADASGRRHAMVQVAGYLARRIVCDLRGGAHVERGQRVGLIMFGSRVDHFIPNGYRVAVKTGDRVHAGVSTIGELEQ
jgi:phosphatidylserine decarboxylase